MSTTGALSTRKTKAIAAILSSRNIQEAGEVANIPQRTIFRWLSEPDFQQALSIAEGELLDGAIRKLTSLSEQAVDVLQDCLDGEVAPYVRLRAAQATLDYILRMRELRGLERRLAALEEVLKDA